MDGVRAVVTTGIYCVPGCSARPYPGNVRAYPCGAAAETAGFRACHRCRPYRLDEVPAGPPMVERAVELIAAGALDETDETGLAARLGTSARHLRRCVVERLGVTPDGLARSRRAHLARRLLDDTDLAVGDVAFAAGFGSLRQFNRLMRATFGESPCALRARRRRTDRLVADGGLAVRLPGPADLRPWLRRRAARCIPGVEHVDAGGYRRVIVLHGDPGAIEVRPGPVLMVHAPRLHGLSGLVHRTRLLAADRAPWDPVEEAVRTAAPDAVGAMVRLLGRPVPGLASLGLTHAFPTATDLLGDPDVPDEIAAAVRALGGGCALDN